MKNILLCCNSMGIGGVETVILNQVVAFSSKGYNVYVMAEKGEYSSNVEELGGNFIEMQFPEENDINKERVEKIVNIIKDKEITEIHIHKYQCIPTMLVASFITQTPYFAYEHGVIDTNDYYTWNYSIYKVIFPIYYKNAYKIIAITPKVAGFTKEKYKIDENKYIIIHNSIDFNNYQNDSPNYDNNIKQVLIVSRLDKDKLSTIYNGIDAFKTLKKIYPEATLNIVGGGNAEKEIIEYLNQAELKSTYKDENVPVKFLGKQTDIKKYLKNNDLFLGVDRCALEAIAMKIPVIITGYKGINGLVTGENIKIAMEENFSGFNMPSINEEECEKQIINLKENRPKIINEVYEVAQNNLDCYKNYINIPNNQQLNVDWVDIFEHLKENIDLIEKQSKDIQLKYEWIQKIEKENTQIVEKNKTIVSENKKLIETKDEMQEKIITKDEEIKMMKKEIKEIYNSKRWKCFEKVSNIFHKKAKQK